MISFFLAPFGLWFAWKYLKQDDRESKVIGVVSIALTIAALAITLWTLDEVVHSANETLRSLKSMGL